ncbi:hypothetical protein PISMIDRAFT_671900 [Pisolithus microcarpus 441]|uniref:Uncharacterized protein n=1 Tax=Pisolithus microcarpus 441 TaxID=765257 RepID=A0A0D0A662_9AGAM|nr:hypothetical protein PISMIDRAFT_671900 [Pisolithus microcarpus 441]
MSMLENSACRQYVRVAKTCTLLTRQAHHHSITRLRQSTSSIRHARNWIIPPEESSECFDMISETRSRGLILPEHASAKLDIKSRW